MPRAVPGPARIRSQSGFLTTIATLAMTKTWLAPFKWNKICGLFLIAPTHLFSLSVPEHWVGSVKNVTRSWHLCQNPPVFWFIDPRRRTIMNRRIYLLRAIAPFTPASVLFSGGSFVTCLITYLCPGGLKPSNRCGLTRVDDWSQDVCKPNILSLRRM